MASYAGRMAPPGYPNTVVTPCLTRDSQRSCAPVRTMVPSPDCVYKRKRPSPETGDGLCFKRLLRQDLFEQFRWRTAEAVRTSLLARATTTMFEWALGSRLASQRLKRFGRRR